MSSSAGAEGQENASDSDAAKSGAKPGQPAKCAAVAELDATDDVELYEKPDRIAAQAQANFPVGDGLLAGVEIEFVEMQVLDLAKLDGLGSNIAKTFHKKMTTPDYRLPKIPLNLQNDFKLFLKNEENLNKRRHNALLQFKQRLAKGTEIPSYEKRTPVFSPPNGSWVGTTDSVGPFHGRLELVSSPISYDGWKSSKAVLEDLKVLEKLEKYLKMETNNALFQIAAIKAAVPQLRIHLTEALFYKEPLRYDFQFTRQIPIFRVTGKKTMQDFPEALRVAGLEPHGLALVIDTVNTFAHGSIPGGNPKEAWSELLKTPLDKVLGRPENPLGDAAVKAWIEGVAAQAKITDLLEADCADHFRLIGKGSMKPNEAGFTWRTFLDTLIRQNKDKLAADWAPTAFGGEDFGYATLGKASVKAGHAIFELRRPFSASPTDMVVDSIKHLVEKWSQLTMPS